MPAGPLGAGLGYTGLQTIAHCRNELDPDIETEKGINPELFGSLEETMGNRQPKVLGGLFQSLFAAELVTSMAATPSD